MMQVNRIVEKARRIALFMHRSTIHFIGRFQSQTYPTETAIPILESDVFISYSSLPLSFLPQAAVSHRQVHAFSPTTVENTDD
jgi:hypothetical protein